MKHLVPFLTYTLPMGLFVATKVGGVSLAAWSWWWLLMPIVPCLGIVVQKAGL